VTPLAVSLPASADRRRCDIALLQKVLDEESLKRDTNAREAATDLMCLDESNKSTTVVGWGFNLGVPIDGVPVQAGLDHKDASAQAWVKKHCTSAHKTKSYSDALSSLKKVGAGVAYAAWSQCVKDELRNEAKGITCDIDGKSQATDGKWTFSYTYRFVPLDLSNPIPTVTFFDTINATCSNPPKKGARLQVQDQVICQQISNTASAVVTLRTTSGPCPITLDAAPAPAPPKPPAKETCSKGAPGAGDACREYAEERANKCGSRPMPSAAQQVQEEWLRCVAPVQCLNNRGLVLDDRDKVCALPDETSKKLCHSKETELKTVVAMSTCENFAGGGRPF
jgi:hypothetical protein